MGDIRDKNWNVALEKRRVITLNKLLEGKTQEEIAEKWKEALKIHYEDRIPSNYTITATIPYDEDGGLRYIKAHVTNVLTHAEAIKAVANELNIAAIEDVNGQSEYGIVDIVRTSNVKKYTQKEVMEIVNLTLKMHYKQDFIEGGKNRILDNKDEVLLIVKEKFQL